ncbi:hypothetical protein PVAP13_2KG064416 [Panicum virgatum]|uniref:Uncharacterized protein n=1 Tax=Panicum virgatum TaxID=38727 RepID=A0A8T0VT20_PANVG|nr:hypothetical protein PVAP13_2KG064416 [Panicum virgatum]
MVCLQGGNDEKLLQYIYCLQLYISVWMWSRKDWLGRLEKMSQKKEGDLFRSRSRTGAISISLSILALMIFVATGCRIQTKIMIPRKGLQLL